MFILVFVVFIFGFTNVGVIILVPWLNVANIIPLGLLFNPLGLLFPSVYNPLGF